MEEEGRRRSTARDKRSMQEEGGTPDTLGLLVGLLYLLHPGSVWAVYQAATQRGDRRGLLCAPTSKMTCHTPSGSLPRPFLSDF